MSKKVSKIMICLVSGFIAWNTLLTNAYAEVSMTPVAQERSYWCVVLNNLTNATRDIGIVW